ncbi:hypothetical protein A3D77_07885 [Candidatus Gottesmanbacteria bacterium RIFCSPHIGHO2_02_FULL_39_11]|uniref:Uncharacterized protein n=1 Tax=Candidatus Gottesmanbacteria bacterium RIFCSPHIGHO2_02_FULL_39_11 TaxID=1798382 RepID=A0A1F5ZTV5_9BACT|nr:MAG: hypothetical protein A3D77_07885 [Candidatus Gottesmanbacteria bacterium RIFCSPHIGHO2_02_FULL_39_11]
MSELRKLHIYIKVESIEGKRMWVTKNRPKAVFWFGIPTVVGGSEPAIHLSYHKIGICQIKRGPDGSCTRTPNFAGSEPDCWQAHTGK